MAVNDTGLLERPRAISGALDSELAGVLGGEKGKTVYYMLGRSPFLDRIELSYLYGISSTTCYRYLGFMERAGLVAWCHHSTRYLRNSRRYYLTGKGLRVLSELEGEDLRDRFSVSRGWRRAFLQRMDAVGSIYRFAASLAMECGTLPVYVNNCMRGPWDAFLEFPNGAMVGVMRQGLSMTRYAMRDRFWRMTLRDGGPPPMTFVIASDELERQEAVKRLVDYPGLPALVVREMDTLDVRHADARWMVEDSAGRRTYISSVVERVIERGPPSVGYEDYWRWSARDGWSAYDGDSERLQAAPTFMMTSAEKRFLDVLHDWPLSKRQHYMSVMDVSASRLTDMFRAVSDMGFVEVIRTGRSDVKRYALSDAGLTYLCRRDRTEVRAKLDKLSVSEGDDGEFRGGSVKVIARELEHNDGLSYFIDRLWSDPRGGWARMESVPTHRARRRFVQEGQVRIVMPDALVDLESADGRLTSLMVEYERRAKYPSAMGKKLMPYRRYFDSQAVYEDCDGVPLVLFVLGSSEAESVFLRAVWNDMERSRGRVPFLCTTDELVREVGPLGPIWRMAWSDGDRRVELLDVSVRDAAKG